MVRFFLFIFLVTLLSPSARADSCNEREIEDLYTLALSTQIAAQITYQSRLLLASTDFQRDCLIKYWNLTATFEQLDQARANCEYDVLELRTEEFGQWNDAVDLLCPETQQKQITNLRSGGEAFAQDITNYNLRNGRPGGPNADLQGSHFPQGDDE